MRRGQFARDRDNINIVVTNFFKQCALTYSVSLDRDLSVHLNCPSVQLSHILSFHMKDFICHILASTLKMWSLTELFVFLSLFYGQFVLISI